MIVKKIYLLIVLTITVVYSIDAQTTKGKGDIFNLKEPEILMIESDTNVIHEDEGDEYEDYSEKSKSVFDPRKFQTIISEDTSSIDDGEISIVEVDEEIKLDCVWVKIAEYYSVWDSRSVNPYRIDHSRFRDTVQVILYDSTKGRYWAAPLKNTFRTDDFGPRKYRWHFGTDLELDIGDSLFAAFDGIVRISTYAAAGYGNHIVLRHYNGLETLYAHLSKSHVDVGQYVKAGEFIGRGGNTGRSTGPHLHFEVRFEGTPIDPEYFYDFKEEELISRVCLITEDNFQYLNRARRVYYHRVTSGQTISSISRKYRVPASRICKLNGISMKTRLKKGRKLRIK
jgi:hypothetical protein